MLKKVMQTCEDFEWLQVLKIECYSLHNASPYVESFTFTFSDLFVGVFKVKIKSCKSWCNANLKVDVTSFFALFVLIFKSAHEAFSIV